MPWEYHAQLRSTWSVWLAAICLKVSHLFGLDGKGALFISRVLTSITGLIILFRFSKVLQRYTSTIAGKIAAKWLPVTFCILPFLLNRFSAEVLSMYLLLGVLLFVFSIKKSPSHRQLFILGAGMMLTFFVRHAIVLALIPFFIWFVMKYKPSLKGIAFVLLGSMAMAAVSVALDSLYYGQFALTPYNYFTANFVENRAANFGVYPWHFYFSGMITRLGWTALVILIICALGTLIKGKSTPFFWMILCSVVGFSLIGHKELRFLFSLIPFVIAGLIWLIDKIVPKALGKGIALTVITINLLLGFTVALTPADDGLSNVNSFISKEKLEGPIFIQAIDIHPFSPHGLVSRAYSNPRLKCCFLENEDDIFQLETGSTLICHEIFLSKLNDEGIEFEILTVGYGDLFSALHSRDLGRRVNLIRIR